MMQRDPANLDGSYLPSEKLQVPLTLAADWPAPARVRAMTSLRQGGTSEGLYRSLNLGARCGDDAENVARNRAIFITELPSPPHWLNQVHGVQVAEFSVASSSIALSELSKSLEPIADAAITTEPGVVLSVLSADCLPIFFTNRQGNAVGVAHAGWRGLAGGVIESTLNVLSQRRPNSQWLAHLGPAIGPGAFEVGAEVRAEFCDADSRCARHFRALPAAGKYLADLYGLARLRLERFTLHSISGGAYCTHRDEALFYSHRRDRRTGRMASVIWFE